jgi:roadblock/LC7 domain-containing protein
MATVDELIKIEGIAAVGEFRADGSLVGYKANMEMPKESAAVVAQFCATVSMLFNTLAGAFTQMSGMNWTPAQGWVFAGGEWSVCVADGKGVFVETAKADFNKLFAAMVGGRP